MLNKCRKSKLITEEYKGFIILTQVICINYIIESMFQFEGNDIDMWMWLGIALGLVNSVLTSKSKINFEQKVQRYEQQ